MVVKSNSYKHRILLAVSGLSPQIITETIYGLAHQKSPVYPTEMHLFTTSEGYDRARLTLLGDVTEKSGWLKRLENDYGLPKISFNESNIHVLRDNNGTPLDDIRKEEDNILLADLITKTIQEIISKYGDDCSLHVSIAGGRKTMGFYIGYALSLLGRMQDRLSHVLVSEHFENHPEFFYPTPYTNIITTKDHKPLNTTEAVVTLSEIPFVRLANVYAHKLFNEQLTYSDLVSNAQKAVEGKIELFLDDNSKQILATGSPVVLSPIDYAFYRTFIFDRLTNNKGYHHKIGGHEIDNEFKRIYAHFGLVGDVENFKIADKDFFDRRLNAIRAAFRKALGSEGAKPYLISNQRNKPYKLSMDKQSIVIKNNIRKTL